MPKYRKTYAKALFDKVSLLYRNAYTKMMYPIMTLDDAEIVHSEMGYDGRVKVYIEKPDKKIRPCGRTSVTTLRTLLF